MVLRSQTTREGCLAFVAYFVLKSKSAHTGTWSDGFSQART